jgi:hypothetical protein
MHRLKLTRLMLWMNSDDDEGSSLVADDEAHLSCLADCGLHKHHPFKRGGNVTGITSIIETTVGFLPIFPKRL